MRKAIKRMNNKKAADKLGWKAWWIKEVEELVETFYISLNRIKTENQIQKQYQLTTVKSIHKGRVKENIQKNQRAYLVNKVSKIYEKALKIQNENKI